MVQSKLNPLEEATNLSDNIYETDLDRVAAILTTLRLTTTFNKETKTCNNVNNQSFERTSKYLIQWATQGQSNNEASVSSIPVPDYLKNAGGCCKGQPTVIQQKLMDFGFTHFQAVLMSYKGINGLLSMAKIDKLAIGDIICMEDMQLAPQLAKARFWAMSCWAKAIVAQGQLDLTTVDNFEMANYLQDQYNPEQYP